MATLDNIEGVTDTCVHNRWCLLQFSKINISLLTDADYSVKHDMQHLIIVILSQFIFRTIVSVNLLVKKM